MHIHAPRRQLLGITAAAIATQAVSRSASAQSTGVPKMEYAIKKLPFDPAKIKGLSEKLLVSHYENNYSGAVKRLNAITAQLAALDVANAPVFVVNGLKREELIATNSMIIHELYFDGLGGEGDPKGPLAEALRKDFGSVERWKAEFVAMGKALGGGSGWVLLTWSPRDKRLVNTWLADHTHSLANGRPVLALDMYEHAYHMDYGARAAAYVDAFMQVIRWDNAVALYERYSKEA
jgi:Fe-Mn family superoxide dismutase